MLSKKEKLEFTNIYTKHWNYLAILLVPIVSIKIKIIFVRLYYN